MGFRTHMRREWGRGEGGGADREKAMRSARGYLPQLSKKPCGFMESVLSVTNGMANREAVRARHLGVAGSRRSGWSLKNGEGAPSVVKHGIPASGICAPAAATAAINGEGASNALSDRLLPPRGHGPSFTKQPLFSSSHVEEYRRSTTNEVPLRTCGGAACGVIDAKGQGKVGQVRGGRQREPTGNMRRR